MCGIIGIISDRDVVPDLLSGLRRLEYRGYDSSGVAGCNEGKLDQRRAAGRITELERGLAELPFQTSVGHCQIKTC